MCSIAVDLVTQKISLFDERMTDQGDRPTKRRSLLDDYLQNPKLDIADVVGMACDLLLAGIDTVSCVTILAQFFIYLSHFFPFFCFCFFLFKFIINIKKTTYSTCFLLYHIARNKEVQEKLFEESLRVIPNYESDEITVKNLNNQLSYSRAVLKESLRLNPISVGVGRTTNTDLVLSGHNVPKGVSLNVFKSM